MTIDEEIVTLLQQGICCPNCLQLLEKAVDKLQCLGCQVTFMQNSQGVWDMRVNTETTTQPFFYVDEHYKSWKKVFAEVEVKDWAIYKTPVRRYFSQAGHRKIGKAITKSIEANEFLLEIGAGNGALLDHLKVHNYIGVDHCIASLSELKSRHSEAIAICTSGTTLPFSKQVFKHICSLHVLEHLYLLAEHCEEVIRLLSKNGSYHYVIPTEGGFAFWLGRKFITGPHLRKKYNLDINRVMEREHINDANRVMKFLKMYFNVSVRQYWPFVLPSITFNVMIYGKCHRPK